MKAFRYNNELYLRAVPGKQLFRSTMVHEVVNRGDIFALRIRDQVLTVIPGTAAVEHLEMNPQFVVQPQTLLTLELTEQEVAQHRAENARAKLRAIRKFMVGNRTIAEATRLAAADEPSLFEGELE